MMAWLRSLISSVTEILSDFFSLVASIAVVHKLFTGETHYGKALAAFTMYLTAYKIMKILVKYEAKPNA